MFRNMLDWDDSGAVKKPGDDGADGASSAAAMVVGGENDQTIGKVL